jgi:hypothetical protein
VEHVGLFYGNWEDRKAVWYTLWPYDNMLVIWFIFPRFWYIVPRKIWQAWFCLRLSKLSDAATLLTLCLR